MVAWGRNKSNDNGDREQLLQQSERLDDGLEKLGESRRVMDETHELGAHVMNKLLSQRETIIRSTNYATETGSYQRETRSLIRAASWSDFYTKLLMHITIVLLIVAILFVLVKRITH
ncbi:hypothetical protein BgAZ_106460 [Babesia gibsoni]|uniref:t-SNARE coiled-coil homology domain-containing protein n=1 Tax=Babesia gibsoni TaxID=33632 RepID=A0AAD8PGG3_BABGI|nr:hypothetical protein BgAZ_106460 [Babesia gibsoni]